MDGPGGQRLGSMGILSVHSFEIGENLIRKSGEIVLVEKHAPASKMETRHLARTDPDIQHLA